MWCILSNETSGFLIKNELSTQYKNIKLPLIFEIGHSCGKLYLFEMHPLKSTSLRSQLPKLRVSKSNILSEIITNMWHDQG